MPETTSSQTHPVLVALGVQVRKSDYVRAEFENFRNNASDLAPELCESYRKFLDDGFFRERTMLRLDVLKVFAADVDNRAQIDYREGEWDNEPSVVRGGKYFDGLAKKLKGRIAELEKQGMRS
jgi:hypothetical protein